MAAPPSVLSIDLPPLIRSELKDRYPLWYKNCLFRNSQRFEDVYTDLTILPAQFLIQNVKEFNNRKIIPFGSAELLEQSYLAGASDYLKEPWNCQELVIRSQPFLDDMKIRIGKDCITYKGNALFINNCFITLTPYQNRLMKVLMKNSNNFLEYTVLSNYLGMNTYKACKSLHVHLHNLRERLKAELPDLYGNGLIIENSSKLGYALIFTCG
ncbi:helix-turn-helix domain-containing protein [Oceanispirochaeta sp.]|jgi:hypothetical protein|uniref:helix-turn-helix domain-containing protein n=1 Tax=Oceanispirochaeta sp. TaxID=2035350 RepID=UPI00260BDD2C|nr:helix-turn-helix domain-containing protein [Oceanispirochaeta sp.]MDA3955499.1 helix-turn-helix domain-containing protein [Oceanispirochaeta sp.]